MGMVLVRSSDNKSVRPSRLHVNGGRRTVCRVPSNAAHQSIPSRRTNVVSPKLSRSDLVQGGLCSASHQSNLTTHHTTAVYSASFAARQVPVSPGHALIVMLECNARAPAYHCLPTGANRADSSATNSYGNGAHSSSACLSRDSEGGALRGRLF